MLVLSRKVGETIRISDNIAITVVSLHGDKVRIGIAAPREVPVHRGEVWAAIQKMTGAEPDTKSDPAPGDKPT